MSNEYPSDNYHEYDELVGTQVVKQPQIDENKTRSVNLILDPSAFTGGIGNIKRWYNKEYVEGRLKSHKKSKNNRNETIEVNIYIPSYTLHEFDYLKKGTSMIATYARQSIKFIDELFESNLTSLSLNDRFNINLAIESPQERGPPWPQCLSYQVHSPKVKEFPNFRTKFDSSYIGQKFEDNNNVYDGENHDSDFNSSLNQTSNKINDIQYENSASYLNAAANAENFAVMPARLKYLISSCIFKKFIQNESTNNSERLNDWILVSEDSITQIWARSFGVDCMNVNEAELLLFQKYDVNRLYNPASTFTLDDDIQANSILQDTIDTSLYAYTKLDDPNSRKKNTQRGKKNHTNRQNRRKEDNFIRGVTNDSAYNIKGELIKKERFDSINYAPRGKGELWKP